MKNREHFWNKLNFERLIENKIKIPKSNYKHFVKVIQNSLTEEKNMGPKGMD
jgi:hypothetical protein